MLRLFDEGVVTEDEVREAFRATRGNARNPRFREEIEGISDDRLRGLILDEGGLDRWLYTSDSE